MGWLILCVQKNVSVKWKNSCVTSKSWEMATSVTSFLCVDTREERYMSLDGIKSHGHIKSFFRQPDFFHLNAFLPFSGSSNALYSDGGAIKLLRR